MIKADKYLKETIQEILESGSKDKNPRPKNSKGEPAHSRFITQKVFEYNISANQFPITTLRTTALKGGFHDIEAIYIKQTNILEEMHPSIHSWWKDFCTFNYTEKLKEVFSLGATYGSTVRRYDLMNKLLKGLEENPFGRRHSINLNQEQQKIDDPLALVPCAFETLWSIREIDLTDVHNKIMDKIEELLPIFLREEREDKQCLVRFIDLTLFQRSMDFVMTASINPAQYVMLGMMVANHLTFKTGIKHEIGKFLHIVQNCHIYEAHIPAAKEILERESINEQPLIKLNCKPKDFYEHAIDDFEFVLPKGIKKLENTLELMT